MRRSIYGRNGEVSDGLIVRQWRVTVNGYGSGLYVAKSRGMALSQAFLCDAFCQMKFKDFLRIANATGEQPDERFGEQITVGGRPAFWVGCNRQYMQFVRSGSDVVMHSHPYDVEPPEARRGTSYYQEQSA
jgi:hypothetical protein